MQLLTILFSVDMDKLISVKGLVIRTTPVIPDMKEGKERAILIVT